MSSNPNANSSSGSSDETNPTIQNIRDIMAEITVWLLVVSIVGSAFTILTFVVFKEIRTYPIKIILYLCVCIMWGYTAVNISDQSWVVDNNWLCITIAVMSHYFLLADFCWTFAIAFNFYQMIVKRNREAQKLEKWYHLGAWGIPAIISTVVGATGFYGSLGTVCYITDQWVTFGTFFVPGLIIISANSILFFLIGREIAETLAGAPKTDQRDRKTEFRVYISIFISLGLSWVFGYIEVLIKQEIASLIFFIIFTIMTPAQGILIFLFYCFNFKVAMKWAGLFGKVFPCCLTLQNYLHKSSTSTTSSRGSSSRGGDSSSRSST